MDLQIVSSLVTIVLFAGLGWFLAHRRARSAGGVTFVALLAGAILGGFIGRDARLLDVFGFAMHLNTAIVAACLGALVGGLLRHRRPRLPQV